MAGSTVAQGIATPIVRVDDWLRAKDFYERVLGFRVRELPDSPGGGIAEAGDGTSIMLQQRPEEPLTHPTVTLTVSDLDAAVSDLTERGAEFEPIVAGRRAMGGIATVRGERVAWLRDSEGNLIALMESNG